jgi:hypothetical protein
MPEGLLSRFGTGCNHLFKDSKLPFTEIRDSKNNLYKLCAECIEIYNNDPKDNPKDSRAYHIYHSSNPFLSNSGSELTNNL